MLFDSKATYIRMILSLMITEIPISYHKDNYMCIMFDIIQIMLQYNMPRSRDLPVIFTSGIYCGAKCFQGSK